MVSATRSDSREIGGLITQIGAPFPSIRRRQWATGGSAIRLFMSFCMVFVALLLLSAPFPIFEVGSRPLSSQIPSTLGMQAQLGNALGSSPHELTWLTSSRPAHYWQFPGSSNVVDRTKNSMYGIPGVLRTGKGDDGVSASHALK
jgi:hypothetical protein